MSRRAKGALEAEVLAALWAADGPMTPDEARTAIDGDLAYTTVQTILVRLHEKGAVRRTPHGRGYAYAPVLDESGLVARRMRQLLDGEGDRAGVLSRFVSELRPADEAALRRALRRRS
ncbi:MAG: BlaI/MecI/CopY family transcriptional regulator [Mycobacteriales bacterium]